MIDIEKKILNINELDWQLFQLETMNQFCIEMNIKDLHLPNGAGTFWESKWKTTNVDGKTINYQLTLNDNSNNILPVCETIEDNKYFLNRISPFQTYNEVIDNEPKIIDKINREIEQYDLFIICSLTNEKINNIKKEINNKHIKKFNKPIVNLEITILP